MLKTGTLRMLDKALENKTVDRRDWIDCWVIQRVEEEKGKKKETWKVDENSISRNQKKGIKEKIVTGKDSREGRGWVREERTDGKRGREKGNHNMGIITHYTQIKFPFILLSHHSHHHVITWLYFPLYFSSIRDHKQTISLWNLILFSVYYATRTVTFTWRSRMILRKNWSNNRFLVRPGIMISLQKSSQILKRERGKENGWLSTNTLGDTDTDSTTSNERTGGTFNDEFSRAGFTARLVPSFLASPISTNS